MTSIYPLYDFTSKLVGNRAEEAILFEITRTLGLKRYHFTRKDYDYEDGRIVFVIVPVVRDIDSMLLSIERTPILETIQKKHKLFKKGGK